MMHSNHFDGWLCGPGSFLSGVPFGGVFHLIVWGLALFLLYRLARTIITNNKSSEFSESLNILEKRYASGEIDQEEFFKRKKDLGH